MIRFHFKEDPEKLDADGYSKRVNELIFLCERGDISLNKK